MDPSESLDGRVRASGERMRDRPCFSSWLALTQCLPLPRSSIAASTHVKEGTRVRVWGSRKGHLTQKNPFQGNRSGQAASRTAYSTPMVGSVGQERKGLTLGITHLSAGSVFLGTGRATCIRGSSLISLCIFSV